MVRKASAPAPAARRPAKVSSTELDRLIAEATTDAYNESEQATGFYTLIEDHLALPFRTLVLGVEVEVEAVDLDDDDQLVALVRRGQSQQRLPLAELPLPDPPPAGAEWIAAYCRWLSGQY